jgi:hypothetical protein
VLCTRVILEDERFAVLSAFSGQIPGKGERASPRFSQWLAFRPVLLWEILALVSFDE